MTFPCPVPISSKCSANLTCVHAGAKERDFRRVPDQQTYKYDALGNYKAGPPLYSPYSEVIAHSRSSNVSTKQLRHSSSLPGSSQSPSLGTNKPTGLNRSQLAEEKHIKRQNSVSDATGGSKVRPMSAERSRPSSAASQRSNRDSISRESTSSAARRLSSGRSYARAETDSKYDGNVYPRSIGKPASRPASPDPSPHTIPAYNPLPGRNTFTGSNQPTSRYSLGATGSSATDFAHLSASIPSAPLLCRSSTDASTGGHPYTYATQASDCWGQEHQVKKRTTSSAQGAGPQDFLSLLERSKEARFASASHSMPKRTNSNPRELFERSGQFMYSLGDKFRR